jgi:hypothetical protein
MRGITEERSLFIHSFISVIYSLRCMMFTFAETSHNASMRCCEVYNYVMLQETTLGGVKRYTCVYALRVVLAVAMCCYTNSREKENVSIWNWPPK